MVFHVCGSDDNDICTMGELFEQWYYEKMYEQDEYADESFIVHYFQIVESTLRLRNEVEIIGIPHDEMKRIYNRLLKRAGEIIDEENRRWAQACK